MQSNAIRVEEFNIDPKTGQITIWHSGASEVRDLRDFMYYLYVHGMKTTAVKVEYVIDFSQKLPYSFTCRLNEWLTDEATNDVFDKPDAVIDMGKGPAKLYMISEPSLPPGVVAGSHEHMLYNRWMENNYGSYQEI